jgi:hypothetical protein
MGEKKSLILLPELGGKCGDLLAELKGPSAAWVVLPAPLPAMPELGGFVTFEDAAKAKTILDTLSQNINATFGKEVVQPSTKKTHTLYKFDLTVIDTGASKSHPHLYIPPYPKACFALVENHLFFGSSEEALQKQFEKTESKKPGLLTHPEFIKAAAKLNADEHKSPLVYVDIKSLLIEAGNFIVPILATAETDETLKKSLTQLAPPAELFKELTPLTITLRKSNDRVFCSIHTPLPIMPTIMAVGMGSIFVRDRNRKALKK